jgi:valyl-tRNA synthetase
MLNKKFTLSYTPSPEKILSSMREKQNEMSEEMFNGEFSPTAKLVYEIAWRDACLHCLEQIKDTADVASLEKDKQLPVAYLERVYDEIMKDNALSPFVNYIGD